MKITEIVAESVVQVWSRTKGGQMVRKYRCTAGPRKGRIVSAPGVCTQPKRLGSVMAIKKAKARRGSTMKIKRAFTKRTSAPSVRLGRLNKQRAGRNAPPRRSSMRHRGAYKRKPIRA
jgi:hypothetical protein